MRELAVSTWSLHRDLGPMYPGVALEPASRPDLSYGEGAITLLEAPATVAAMGIHNLEVCHFHFPRVDSEYLAEFRRQLQSAGVRFLTLLIDTGDITAPEPETREQHLAHIRRWIEIAAEAGAKQVRVIAGDAEPDPEGVCMRRSIEGLRALEEFARSLGVGVITENWHALAMSPDVLLTVLDGLEGRVGLCGDFGNYSGPTKYEDLAAILPRAITIHAKADFPRAGEIDMDDFCRCLDLSREAGFEGHYVLIFDGPGEEQPSLRQMAEVVQPYLQN